MNQTMKNRLCIIGILLALVSIAVSVARMRHFQQKAAEAVERVRASQEKPTDSGRSTSENESPNKALNPSGL
jgi:hypothetical protein